MIDDYGTWSDNQSVTFQVFSNAFNRRLKNNPMVALQQAIPLTKDISSLDDEWLTREAKKKKS